MSVEQSGFIRHAPEQLHQPQVHEIAPVRSGFMGQLRKRWVSALSAGILALGAANIVSMENPAYADDSLQATIGMPFKGEWAYDQHVDPPYTDQNSSHPSKHASYGFDWATDLYAPSGEDVRVYGSSAQGNVTFKRTSVTDTCSSYGKNIAGQGVTFDVLVQGNKVGEVKYDHIDPDAIGSDPIASGTKIGRITSEPKHPSCYQTYHLHVQFDNDAQTNACYVKYDSPGDEVQAGAPIGVLGSPNANPKEECAPGTGRPQSTPPPPKPLLNLNPQVHALPGDWYAGGGGQGFAYVTKNWDGGFDVAVWDATPQGLVSRGVEWTQPGSTGVRFDNTLFIPADVDGDGLKDLYYASSTDWNRRGFEVGLMHNTGTTFEYVGSKWNVADIALKDIKFLPGDWSGTGREAFAYITRNPDNGFSVATFDTDPNMLGTLNWTGTRMVQSGDSGVQFDNTVFNQADTDGDGDLDLLYTTARDWNAKGFTMGLMRNNGPGQFSWGGTKWPETNLKLGTTRFIPGKWLGGARDSLAYVTRREDTGGFDLGLFSVPDQGQFVWQGNWMQEPGLQYDKTAFIPADITHDGFTDLLYATPMQPGFTTAQLMNRRTAPGFDWSGHPWSPTNIGLDGTGFLAGY